MIVGRRTEDPATFGARAAGRRTAGRVIAATVTAGPDQSGFWTNRTNVPSGSTM